MILSAAEIVAITGRRRFTAQCRALMAMGIRYAVRTDGSPVVSRAAVDAVLGAAKVEKREPELRL